MRREMIAIPGYSEFPLIRALVGFKNEIEDRLSRFPYEENVFLMMRFRDGNRDLSDFIIETLAESGLRGVRADQPEWNITNNVFNPIAVLYCCRYGIALFDKPELNQAYNPNVIYELAIMHSQDKKCLILRYSDLPQVPFDLIKDLYMPYEGDLAVRTNIRKWLLEIGVSRRIDAQEATHTAETGLQDAVLDAEVPERASVVPFDDSLLASRFKWQVSSRRKKSWKIGWQVRLSNVGKAIVLPKIQLICLANDGFALLDNVERLNEELRPGASLDYESTLTIPSLMGGRLTSIMLTVSSDP